MSWNGWRVLAAYRSWVGWALVGIAFAAAYHFGWIDSLIVDSVGSHATNIVREVFSGGRP